MTFTITLPTQDELAVLPTGAWVAIGLAVWYFLAGIAFRIFWESRWKSKDEGLGAGVFCWVVSPLYMASYAAGLAVIVPLFTAFWVLSAGFCPPPWRTIPAISRVFLNFDSSDSGVP